MIVNKHTRGTYTGQEILLRLFTNRNRIKADGIIHHCEVADMKVEIGGHHHVRNIKSIGNQKKLPSIQTGANRGEKTAGKSIIICELRHIGKIIRNT